MLPSHFIGYLDRASGNELMHLIRECVKRLNGPQFVIREFDYYLIQELVGMDDRILARMIELVSFPNSAIPIHWDKFVKALEESEGQTDFQIKAKKIIKDLGAKFSVSETYYKESEDYVKAMYESFGVNINKNLDTGGDFIVLLNGNELASK